MNCTHQHSFLEECINCGTDNSRVGKTHIPLGGKSGKWRGRADRVEKMKNSSLEGIAEGKSQDEESIEGGRRGSSCC